MNTFRKLFMKTFTEWLEEAKNPAKPKDGKTLNDAKDKKKTVERPDHKCFGENKTQQD